MIVRTVYFLCIVVGISAWQRSLRNIFTRRLFSVSSSTISSSVSSASNPQINDEDISAQMSSGQLKTYFIETHGCQMNIADSDIVRAVLHAPPLQLQPSDVLEDADLILVNTCAIREQAEEKIIQRIKYFQSIRKTRRKSSLSSLSPSSTTSAEITTATASSSQQQQKKKQKSKKLPVIGVLGCMAERLKTQLVDSLKVDFVAGPDSYRQLPSLIHPVTSSQTNHAKDKATFTDNNYSNINDGNSNSNSGDIAGDSVVQKEYYGSSTMQSVANAVLDETYTDIIPQRSLEDQNDRVHAFVTVQRGCDNHCAFCIVPFTRGRERSLPVKTILAQARYLIEKEHVKEIVLLGQNVNSYYDTSEIDHRSSSDPSSDDNDDNVIVDDNSDSTQQILSEGFTRRSQRPRVSGGTDFASLLRQIAAINRDVRVRFQSPHPQSFPDSLLYAIRDEPNICKSLHMPAQHGASSMLQRMERGYSSEAYRTLIQRARLLLSPRHPQTGIDLGISTDMIVGFCGETEAEHEESIQLLRDITFDQAFIYAYSPRLQTPAVTGRRKQTDDVPNTIKQQRLREAIETFQRNAQLRNALRETGRLHVILLEADTSTASSSTDNNPESSSNNSNKKLTKPKMLTGRTDSNKRVLVPVLDVTTGLEYPILDVSAHSITPQQADFAKYSRLIEALQQLTWQSPVESLWSLSQPIQQLLQQFSTQNTTGNTGNNFYSVSEKAVAGSYLVVKIVEARGHTMRAIPLMRVTLLQAYSLLRPDLPQI